MLTHILFSESFALLAEEASVDTTSDGPEQRFQGSRTSAAETHGRDRRDREEALEQESWRKRKCCAELHLRWQAAEARVADLEFDIAR